MTAKTHQFANIPTASFVQMSKHPIIGVFGVLLGVNISVMASRILLVGLPDLRGALGIGIDEASWLPTAFNAAQMFMAPMSVALGAIFGHRKVLLVSSIVYVLSSLLAPLVPDWQVLIFFQIIRGLSSGTFYPLTLNFVTQNLPPRWITFGLAAYALDILGSNHLSYILYAFYSEHASWHWIFWNSVIFTCVMIACILIGTPVQKPHPEFHKMRFFEFLYASAGLTFLYIGLDQGERCDWFNSGLINGLFVSGLFMIVCAVIGRIKAPNPLLDFRFLDSRNILLMGYLLSVYFISLLGTFTFNPIFLTRLQSYRPLEVVPLAALSGFGVILLVPLLAIAAKKIDIRILASIGFTAMGIAFFGKAHVLSTWQWRDFLPWEIIMTYAEPASLVPLITIFLFSDIKPGAVVPVVRGITIGAYFQAVRLFCSEAGGSILQRFLLTREHFWRTILVSHVDGGWQTSERLANLGKALIPNSAGVSVASQRAIELLTNGVFRQVETLAIADCFMILGCFVVSGLFVIALLRPVHVPGSE